MPSPGRASPGGRTRRRLGLRDRHPAVTRRREAPLRVTGAGAVRPRSPRGAALGAAESAMPHSLVDYLQVLTTVGEDAFSAAGSAMAGGAGAVRSPTERSSGPCPTARWGWRGGGGGWAVANAEDLWRIPPRSAELRPPPTPNRQSAKQSARPHSAPFSAKSLVVSYKPEIRIGAASESPLGG
jgi:hypothetical protein